jgi:hypothetical protein
MYPPTVVLAFVKDNDPKMYLPTIVVLLNKNAGTGTFRTELGPKLSAQMRHLIGYRLAYKNGVTVPSCTKANSPVFIL